MKPHIFVNNRKNESTFVFGGLTISMNEYKCYGIEFLFLRKYILGLIEYLSKNESTLFSVMGPILSLLSRNYSNKNILELKMLKTTPII